MVWTIQKLGKGSGTSLIGYIFELYFPQLIGYLHNGYSRTIFITGTNGKTTTRSLIVSLYTAQGKSVCTNTGGANIFRGLAAAMITNMNWRGQAKSTTLILEVEEATLPIVTRYIQPDRILFTNIFRDQLDVYGEIDTTLSYFIQALHATTCPIIINTDDSKLLTITNECDNSREIHGFGVNANAVTEALKFEVNENKKIIQTTSMVEITSAKTAKMKQFFTAQYSNKKKIQSTDISTTLLGTYNLYNCAAALATCYIDLPIEISQSLQHVEPVFGRGEHIVINDINFWLFLTKNPAGMNQTLDVLTRNFVTQESQLNFLLNDNIADGKDVSWIWDCDFEKTAKKMPLLTIKTSGERAFDAALRLETAGFSINEKMVFQGNIPALVQHGLAHEKKGCNIVCIASYTAMLQLRKVLSTYTNIPDISTAGN